MSIGSFDTFFFDALCRRHCGSAFSCGNDKTLEYSLNIYCMALQKVLSSHHNVIGNLELV